MRGSDRGPREGGDGQAASLLEVSTYDTVTVLTLNRPPANALSSAFLGLLREAFEGCAREPTRVVIIASALPTIFSAGADIRELRELDRAGAREFSARGQALWNDIEAFPKPVIAAVRGACVGGGCELAMACDLRVAGQSARFGQPEVNLGLVPGWGGTQRLPRLIGRTAALEMLLTGEPISADRALALGLVNRLVPDDQVLPEARRLADSLAGKPPLTLGMIKEAVRQSLERPLRKGLEVETGEFLDARATKDAQEGIQAFLEKRAPKFQGR
ncbi:MAG: enoyl-CoA hydratase/isomerase family protein [Chloroflexi bacterium]|nr:enoyl-CoA hydratase/isomerase family protein [Chloroflexota bacterium]